MILKFINKALKSSLFKNTFAFTFSNMIFQASRFVTYLYAAKILGPAKYGLWTGLALLLMYCPYIHMGVFNALNREIPYYEGAGDNAKIKEIRNVGYGVAIITAIPIFLLIFLSSFRTSLTPDTVIGLRLVAFLVLVQHYYLFQQMILRSHGMFYLMSIQQIIFAILNLTVVLPATNLYNLPGFIIGQIFVVVVSLSFILYKAPLTFNPIFNLDKSINLAKIGFPIMLVGITFGLLQTTDRFIILKYIGNRELGYYSLSIMAYSMFMLFPLTISQVFYPQMAQQYGKTRAIEDLIPLVSRQLIIISLIMVPIALIVIFSSPVLINKFMPEYLEGLPALKNSMLGLCFLSLVGAFANFLNTIGYQRIYLAIVVFTITISILVNLILIKLNYGIKEIALATSTVNIFYFILMTLATTYIIKRLKTETA